MIKLLRGMRRKNEGGQVIVIVALGIVVFLGFAGLVTDVGLVYASQRQLHTMADAASLAGAQDLQLAGTRTISATEYTNARTTAMRTVVNAVADALGTTIALPACGYTADFTNCQVPNTDFYVSVRTPSTLCVTCDTDRALLVAINHRNVPAFFAQLFGRNSWTVREASVAALSFQTNYAVITLRPPKPQSNGSDQNKNDMDVNGTGTTLLVPTGDIGTNTNLVNSGLVSLGAGYKVHYYDDTPAWSGLPAGKHITKLIADPNYTYPTQTGAPTFASDAAARTTTTACDAIRTAPSFPLTYKVGATPIAIMPASKVHCYNPGIYSYQVSNGTGDAYIFKPGVYFFNAGLKIREAVVGGYTPNSPGVALVFNECNSSCILDANNASTFALNAGSRFGNPLGQEATAAIGFNGAKVETGGTPNLMMTLLVTKDAGCYVQPAEPTTCIDNANNSLNMAGGGSLYLAGVQYAPTDNIKISGGSSGVGFAGQIVAWTVTYSGGTQISQGYPGQEGNGILRLDEACSGSGVNSMSNTLCKP